MVDTSVARMGGLCVTGGVLQAINLGVGDAQPFCGTRKLSF